MSARRPFLPEGPACAAFLRRAAGIAVSLSFLAAPAAAAVSEDAFLDELPTVLSASRLAQPLNETPGAVTVIDREMIRASGARTIAELLRWVPGFQVGNKKGYEPRTAYHLLATDDAPRRMLVRIDGRSAYSPYFRTGIEWHKITVDLEDIERIEVFRGTNAAAYGSQAFMGVVNIVTRAAADTPRLRVRVNQGSDDLQDRSVSVGQQFGSASVRLTAGQEADDGLAGVDDSHHRRRADLRVDWQLAPRHRLEVHGGAVRLEADTGVAGNVLDPQRRLRSEARFGQLRWRWQPAEGEELSLTYFHHAEQYKDRFTVASLHRYLLDNLIEQNPSVPVAHLSFLVTQHLIRNGIPAGDGPVHYDQANEVTRDDVEFEHTFSPTSHTRLVWGLGHRQDRLYAPLAFARHDELTYQSTRLFGNLEWRATPKWLFNAGIMAEDGSYSGVLLAPRLAANYHLTPLHTVRASMSRAHRRPAPFERHSDVRIQEAASGRVLRHEYQPSPNVEAEQITVREVGYHGDVASWQLSADLRVFEERTKRLSRPDGQPSPLTPAPLLGGKADQFISDGAATIRGAELSLMWRPKRHSWLGLNYSRLEAEGDSKAPTRPERDKQNRRIEASVPRVAGSVFAAWAPTPAWHLSATRHYVGAMRWETEGVGSRETMPAYYRTDWRIARRFDVGGSRAEFALIVSNGGDRHADFDPRLDSRRQAYASLGVEF